MNAPPDSPRDVELMEAIAAGDPAALAALYGRYSALVLAICVRILGSQCDAEEVLLDVFWELWTKAGRYNPLRSSPRTYIVQLARSRAIDRARSRTSGTGFWQGAVQLDTVEAWASASPAPPDPPQLLVSQEQSQTVRQALEALDDREREVLQLAYFGGMSQSQIAENLQIPLGTVKTRIRQGLIKLRETLRSLYLDWGSK